MHKHLCSKCNRVYECVVEVECIQPYVWNRGCNVCKSRREKGIKEALKQDGGFWSKYREK